MDRLRELVAAGAVPRNALDKALAEKEDHADDAILRRTLYGSVRVEELNEVQASEMTSAARRRVERFEKQVLSKRTLIAEGLAPRNEIQPLEDELASRRHALELAENRARVFRELLDMARMEAMISSIPAGEPAPNYERFDGSGIFNDLQFRRVSAAFERKFGKPLPVSADGQTELHKAMGYDHRGRIDVALHPDAPEGLWLREYLVQEQVPYFLFRAAMPGSATGPHFHLGPPSRRVLFTD